MSDTPSLPDTPATTDAKAGGITLRLGPDSKMAIPLQGGNLVMMGVIVWQLFTSYAKMPEDIEQIGEDISAMQSDIDELHNADVDLAEKLGKQSGRIEQLEDAAEDRDERIEDLEAKIKRCVDNPKTCEDDD